MVIKSEEKVKNFIEDIKFLLDETESNLYIVSKTKSRDKTREFMNEFNIKHNMIVEYIKELDVHNYSYTDDDHDSKHSGEVWIFGKGIILFQAIEEFYIKLKLRGRVICLSFHIAEHAIKYPYASS